MPELPEVETMRRGILEVEGCRIHAIEQPPCRLKPISIRPALKTLTQRTVDRVIERVGRRGKRIVLHLCDQSGIVIEPRMTGLVLLSDPPGQEHLRLRIELVPSANRQPHGRELLFWDRRGLGTVTWLDQDELQALLGEGKLGPDALEIDATTLRSRMENSQRAIKVALLDQHAVAGIGNLYAAEILHVAGIDPRTACRRLSSVQWQAIHLAMRQVLEEAVIHEGSTLADGTYRKKLNEPGNYQIHHRVYAREDLPCPRCGSPIRRMVQAQRSTFFCEKCQKKRGTAVEFQRKK